MDTTAYHPQRTLRNRIRKAMAHTTRYAFKSQFRLSLDSGLAESTVSRLLRGKTMQPTYRTVIQVTAALERALDICIDPRDLMTLLDAPYPTASLCGLVGCRGCSLSPRRKQMP